MTFFTINYFFLIIIIIVLFYPAESAKKASPTCDSKCYHTVNSSLSFLQKMNEEYKNVSSKAIYPNFFNSSKIDELITVFKQVKNKAHKNYKTWEKFSSRITKTEKEIRENNNVLDMLKEKFSNWRNRTINSTGDELLSMLAELKTKRISFEDVIKLNGKASDTCDSANKKYTILKKTSDDLFLNHENVSRIYDNTKYRVDNLNKDMKQTFEEIAEQRNKLDHFKLPEDVVKSYVYGLESKFNKSIEFTLNNTQILESLLQDLYKNRTSELKKKINEVQKIINSVSKDTTLMKKSIDEFSKGFDITKYKANVTNSLIKDLEETESELKKFQDDIKKFKKEFNKAKQNFEQTKVKLQVAKEELNKYKIELDKLKEYKQFYDLFTKEKREQIKEETEKLKELIRVYYLKEELAAELKKIKKIYKETTKYPCPIDKVNVEE